MKALSKKEAKRIIQEAEKRKLQEKLSNFNSAIRHSKKIIECHVCELFYLHDFTQRKILYFRDREEFHKFLEKVKHKRGAEFLIKLQRSILVINGGITEFELEKEFEGTERLDVFAIRKHSWQLWGVLNYADKEKRKNKVRGSLRGFQRESSPVED